MVFRLAFPFALGLFLFIPGLWWFRRYQFSDSVLIFSDMRLVAGLQKSWRVHLVWLPELIQYTILCLLIVALARPQSGNARVVLQGQGASIVLALDISSSMAALDFAPENRLVAAQNVIADFVSQREFDQLGLVVFARQAFHQVPLTLNYTIYENLLNRVVLVSDLTEIGDRRLDGTALGSGLAASANMLRSSDSISKVIVLLTDGGNNAGIDPIEVARAAAALDIRIYTIGMGRPGLVDIPDADGNLIQVESDLNEPLLGQIATIAGGSYFRAEDTAGLAEIYAQINALERSDVAQIRVVNWQDQAYWLLGAAVVLMLMERFLRLTVFDVNP